MFTINTIENIKNFEIAENILVRILERENEYTEDCVNDSEDFMIQIEVLTNYEIILDNLYYCDFEKFFQRLKTVDFFEAANQSEIDCLSEIFGQ